MKNVLKWIFLLSTFNVYAFSSGLKSDEEVMFIPNIAYGKDGQLYVKVDAWVYEKERRRGFDTLLLKYLGLSKSELSPETLAYYQSQTKLIKVDSERNKQLTIRFANGVEKTLKKTDRSGRSENIFSFPVSDKDQLMNDQNQILFTLVDRPSIQSMALYYEDGGYLILSDIDDTIKESNVLDTKELLKNTFLYPPVPVNNAPEFYQTLAQTHQTPMFVYLSSTPMQFYPTLLEFINTHYPAGVLRLRQSTAWNEILASKKTSYQHKKENIIQLLEAYPNKKVILIGDSGESDIEIYFEIANLYPNQIEKIIIRILNEEGLNKLPEQVNLSNESLLQIVNRDFQRQIRE